MLRDAADVGRGTGRRVASSLKTIVRSGIALIALVLLATACGNSSPPVAESSTDRLQLEVVVAPDPLVSGQPATVWLLVTNVSDQRTLLTFDTTQRGDVSFSTGDVEVYRWSEQRAFALDRERYAFAPGQRLRFPLEVDPLPVAPGEYEVLATVTGVPKLRTVRTTVTVVGAASESPSAGATATPTEEVSAAAALPAAYERLRSALDTTVDDLAVPLASALASGDAFDARAAVLREEAADAMSRLTYAELLMAHHVVAGDDADGPRALAAAAADRLAATIGGLRGVGAGDEEQIRRLLQGQVSATSDYAAVLAAGGDEEALAAPGRELEAVAADLGQFVAVTSGGAIDSDTAAEHFRTWSDAVTRAIREGVASDATVVRAHEAATTAVEPVGLGVAEAYAQYLDLGGFDAPSAVIRQELVTSLTDEVLLVTTAVDVGAVRSAAVTDVLDRNAEELARAVGRAPQIDAAEESALLDLWRARDEALLGAAATPDGDDATRLATIDDEIAQQLAAATDGTLAEDEVAGWLEAQRTAVLDAVRPLAAG